MPRNRPPLLTLLRRRKASVVVVAGQQITDNFTGAAGNLDGKTTTTGSKVWTTAAGLGQFQLDGSGQAFRSDATGDARVYVTADQTDQFQKVAVDLYGDIQSGIFARGFDTAHYWIYYNNGDFIGLAYQVGAGFQFIRQETDVLITLPATITFMNRGKHINGWVNNQLVFVEDMDIAANPMYTTYPNGTLAGIFSEKTTSKFDNFAVASEHTTKQVVCVGDSLTNADNLPQQHGSSVNGFTWQAMNLLGPGYYYHNYGVNGSTLADMNNNAVPLVTPLYKSTFQKNIAVVEGGINDMIAGTSAATIQTRLSTLWGSLTSAGYRVLPVTITPYGTGSTEAIRQTVNTWIRANAPLGVYADVGASGNGLGSAGDQNNLTNYQADNIHYTVTGAGIAAGILRTALQSI